MISISSTLHMFLSPRVASDGRWDVSCSRVAVYAASMDGKGSVRVKDEESLCCKA